MSAVMHGPGPRRPGPPATAAEVLRIALSMTATCAIGAAILGGVFVATDRYQEAARVRGERAAISDLLGLDDSASVQQVNQFLDPSRREVIYRATAADSGGPLELVFGLDGALVRKGAPPPGDETAKGLTPLGRFFIARKGGQVAGFVIESEVQGYKNRIRFFVALGAAGWDIAGVKVVEHEEDPGLGAEVATGWFTGQFVRRPYATMSTLDVTRDPMPEDWRAALLQRGHISPWTWEARNRMLQNREMVKPIYAVTGATISSRALTNGVSTSILHFKRRWDLLRPYMSGKPAWQPFVARIGIRAPAELPKTRESQ